MRTVLDTIILVIVMMVYTPYLWVKAKLTGQPFVPPFSGFD
jgi:hypothetical protein